MECRIMKVILSLIFLLVSTIVFSQDKTYLYPSDQKVTIAGFDKEPPSLTFFKAKGQPNGLTLLVVPGG